jgi:hypothetical protein
MSTPGNHRQEPEPEPESAEAIRADIEETRVDLGDTVEALASKSDVKGRADDRIAGIKQEARAKAEELKQKVGAVTPETARERGGQVVAKARANPMPLAGAAALLLAFLIGRRSARP